MSEGVAAAPAAPALEATFLDGVPAFRELFDRLHDGRSLVAGGLWGSSQALVFAALVQRAQGPWLVVLSNEAEADLFADDLEALGVEPVRFPARESYGNRGAHADPESIRGRLQVAQRLTGPPERRPRVIVASLLSMLQPIPSAADLEQEFLHLQVGQHLELEPLLERLVKAGYARQPLAERPGEVSLRGDILDVFPFASDLPVRIELFDDEIESLRTFEPDSQRSLSSEKRVALCLASDAGGVQDGDGVSPASVLSPTTTTVQIEPLRIEEAAEGLRIQSSAHAHALSGWRRAVEQRSHIALQSLPAESRGGRGLNFETRSVQSLNAGIKPAVDELTQLGRGGARPVVLCVNEAERGRFAERLPVDAGIETALGSLSRGFRLLGGPQALVVVNHRELLGVLGKSKKAAKERKLPVRALESFFELKIGDLVVHAVHGVAHFAGLERMERAGGEEEHLHLLFADDVSMYVPSSRIDLVQRYVGTGSKSPQPDKIGSQAFRKRKEKVEKALVDLAGEMLELQARRETEKRPAWQPEPALVADLLAAFPFEDTKDQAEADREIAQDLAKERAMDRLLCGDVGFGKTEVAMRAAFRVVAAGGQVAVLVPTTVLAHQHFESFKARFADFPIEVETLSRYVPGKKTKEVLARAARGEIDVLIGTHRLLSKDVTLPKLGLLVVDEEQRFGVTHKEHFKRLRAEVDILTLTATPIPRTLHMSLAGVRDISALTVPPDGRQEVETILSWTQEVGTIREAILREKNRGGQVFFLHNRVQSIERRTRELMALVPECTYCIGHGQMGGRELERVMDTFARGAADVLVATTIIENGIDIPTAGTILMDDADRFGLAELHQLRGRVGRGRHKSYCYLLIDRTRPMREVARTRLKALEELTMLGAGFQISMKDLEIRGAGNILGPEQSGHIAAIGYDMYCRLLKQTVERLADSPDLSAEERRALVAEVPAAVTHAMESAAVELELGMKAFLPKDWIPSADDRLDLLRKFNTLETPEDAAEVLAMMRDRFGRVPPEAEQLVRQFQLRPLLVSVGIQRLLYRVETYLVDYSDRVRLEEAFGGRRVELRPLKSGRAHLVIPPESRRPAEALAWFLELLRGSHATPKMA